MDLNDFAQTIHALNQNVERLTTRIDLLSRRLEGRAQGEVTPPANREPVFGPLAQRCLEAIHPGALAGSVLSRRDLIRQVCATLPPPASGKRDTRRQRVSRAVRQLAECRRPVLKLVGDQMTLLWRPEVTQASDLI